MCKVIYTDAKEIRRGTYLIGYCDSDMREGKHTVIKVSDNNQAEMAAVKLAMKHNPNALINTDSLDTVMKINNPNVVHIAREQNLCDLYLKMVHRY